MVTIELTEEQRGVLAVLVKGRLAWLEEQMRNAHATGHRSAGIYFEEWVRQANDVLKLLEVNP